MYTLRINEDLNTERILTLKVIEIKEEVNNISRRKYNSGRFYPRD